MTESSADSFPAPGSGAIRRNWRLGLRLIFGSFWLADAILKWELTLQNVDYADVIAQAASGQPPLISSWVNFWAGIAKATPNFSILIAVLETIIAIFILLGFLTKLTSISGIAFSFLIWSTAEGFGGMFENGATDIGTSPLYMAMFAGLIVVQGGKQHGLDGWLASRFPRLDFLL